MASLSLPSQPPLEEELQELQQQHDTHETVVMNQGTQTQIHEIANRSSPDTTPAEEQAGEQENLETLNLQESISSGKSFSFPELHVVPPVTDPQVAVSDGTVTTPSHNPQNRRGLNKRKKGKPHVKKQQAIEKKLQSLMEKLIPVPFIRPKIIDFSRHEKVLKRLGLWDLVHIDFDGDIRVDLIAQLIASYDPRLRCSYVNDIRIAVNRADLARALKLPVRREKGNVAGVEGVDLDPEFISDESIGFIEEIVSDWVLLHEDAWITPGEVLNWMRMIKDGHPEKVDWASMFWFMMEKELTQGEHLKDCYYASHFQYLIKSQREDLMREKDRATDKVDLGGGAKDEDDEINEEDVKVSVVGEGQEVEGNMLEGLSIKLTLGQEIVEDEVEAKDMEMMDVNKSKEDDMLEGEEQGQWILDGKHSMERHFLEQCNMDEDRGFVSHDDRKEDGRDVQEDGEEEEETGNGLNVLSSTIALEGDGLTGNLLQTMEENLISFSSQGQLRDPSMVDLRTDMQQMDSAAPFFNNTGKRVIEHDNDVAHHSHNDGNKRLRINDMWDHKLVDFGACMDQVQHIMGRARMIYEEKDQAQQELSVNQQILLNELEKRDNVIEHLHKTKLEEIQKRDREIYRYERELYLMGSVLDGYRKALKETQKTFAEYRQRVQLSEEPVYKDAGLGGLMLSTAEIEKLHKKQEEEYRMNCLILEQKAKEAEEDYAGQFAIFLDNINMLDMKLTGLETDAKELIDCYKIRKLSKPEEKISEVSEPLPNEQYVAVEVPLPNE